MSDKVVQTIQAIANDLEQIEDISKSSEEYYFRFKGHVFSILTKTKSDGVFLFYVYPEWPSSIDGLVDELEFSPNSGVKVVSYVSSEYGDEGGTFRNLFEVVKNSYEGVDEIFDDILGNPAN